MNPQTEALRGEILSLMESELYIPLTMRDMTAMLALEASRYDAFAAAVELLIREGRISRTKHDKLILTGSLGLITAIFRGTTRGYGFAEAEGSEDIFIPADKTGGAMHGDRVQVKPAKAKTPPDDRISGEVTAVLERAITEVTGILTAHEAAPQKISSRVSGKKKALRASVSRKAKKLLVTPDDPKLHFKVQIPPSMHNGAKNGDKVLVRLTAYPTKGDGLASGRVLRVFGPADSPESCRAAILHSHGIRTSFPAEVIENAKEAASAPITPEGRLDLRDRVIFTIDGADAKDFDDAISIEKREGGWILGVHIADVSEYVRPESALDDEARQRGTSLYFADRVIPMLPPALSNGVCSLNRDTDKYTLSALISVDQKGRIEEITLAEAIISSSARGIYSEVNDLIEKRENSEFYSKYEFLFPELLDEFLTLYRVLEDKSARRGALDLETMEAGFVLDEAGYPVEVVLRERGTAEKMIEQFMLLANEAVASWLRDASMPCVYRVHEEPSEEKRTVFSMFASNLGLNIAPLRVRRLVAGCYRTVLAEAREKGMEAILTPVMLRSLMKAKYTDMPMEHFGLGCPLYCHFTSPIRRYPDLAVHRIVKSVLRGEAIGDAVDSMEKEAAAAAAISNECELRALNVERDMEALYKTLYLSDHVGEVFDAIISSVTGFGFFAELENTCEGLIPIAVLDGYYNFDEKSCSLVREGKARNERADSRRIYRLGDPIRVEIVSCDLTSRKVEMRPVD